MTMYYEGYQEVTLTEQEKRWGDFHVDAITTQMHSEPRHHGHYPYHLSPEAVLSKIQANDPKLTRLHIQSLRTIFDPTSYMPEFSDTFWIYLLNGNGCSRLEQAVDQACEALSQNMTITSIQLDCIVQVEAPLLYERLFNAILTMPAPLVEVVIGKACQSDPIKGRILASALLGTKDLKILRMPLALDEEEDVYGFIEFLRRHPCLEDVVLRANFQVCAGSRGKKPLSPEILGALCNLSYLSNFEMRDPRLVSVQGLVHLAKTPSLRRITLYGAGLTDEHIRYMVKTINSRDKSSVPMEYVDISGKTKCSYRSMDMLFSMKCQNPYLEVKATAHYEHSRFIKTFSFSLSDPHNVQKHLRYEEISKWRRLRLAGFDVLLRNEKERASKAAWLDIIDTVQDDTIAIYHVLRTNPWMCSVEYGNDVYADEGVIHEERKGKRRKLDSSES